MKIKFASILLSVFALASIGNAKGRQAATPTLAASCDSTGYCAVSASGLSASSNYVLSADDSCGVLVYSTYVTSSSTGGFSFNITLTDSSTCNSTGWVFSLATTGRHGSTVATFIAPMN